MDFSHFCKGLHHKLSGIKSQGQLIGSLFNAAGSNYFPPRPAYDTDSYQRKLYGGSKLLTQEMKDSFPKPINTEGLKSFLQTRIGDSSLSQIMAYFSIPTDDVQDKTLFVTALCTQFQNIISESTSDVGDIVASEYSRLLSKSGTDRVCALLLYPGDDMLLLSETPEQPHEVDCYVLFDHSWTIRNTGKVTWENRCFECINQAETRIKAVNKHIDLPKVKPGGDICLTAQYDARGIEGTFEALWEMKDKDGRDCFPGRSKALKTAAKVVHNRSTTTEV